MSRIYPGPLYLMVTRKGKWENGKWKHVDKVFTLKLEDGQAPVGEPLLDPKGNRNEQKLQDKSDKNKTKENRVPVNYDN